MGVRNIRGFVSRLVQTFYVPRDYFPLHRVSVSILGGCVGAKFFILMDVLFSVDALVQSLFCRGGVLVQVFQTNKEQRTTLISTCTRKKIATTTGTNPMIKHTMIYGYWETTVPPWKKPDPSPDCSTLCIGSGYCGYSSAAAAGYL